MPVVLDCSVAACWYANDLPQSIADEYYATCRANTVIVPSIWPLEVLNVVVMHERRHGRPEAQANLYLQLLDQLDIEVSPAPTRDDWDRILVLARSHQLTIYDASYLDLAMRADATLLTCDMALIRAATAAGIAVYAPKAQDI